MKYNYVNGRNEMFFKKAFKEDRGAALIWAMCAATIVLILVGASMTLATAYHEKTLNKTASKQAYFSALSAAELVVNEIVNGNTYASVDELINESAFVPTKGTTKSNAKQMTIVFSNDPNVLMGECSVWVYWKDDTTLVVESDSQYKDQDDSVIVELGYYSSDGGSGSGNGIERNVFGTRSAMNTTSNVVFKNTDIYLLDIDNNFKMDWVLNEGNLLYASKSSYQTFLDSIWGWFPWLGDVFGSIDMSDFIIITENDYNSMVNATVKPIPTGADIITRTLSRARDIEDLLANLEPGKTYVINYTNRTSKLDLNVGFTDDLVGTSKVYFVRPKSTRGAINIETIEEGVEFYYYGYESGAQLNLGENKSTLNMIGGIYGEDDIKFMGDINFNGYMLLESANPKLNVTGNALFNVGYVQTSTLTYSWEIEKYSN